MSHYVQVSITLISSSLSTFNPPAPSVKKNYEIVTEEKYLFVQVSPILILIIAGAIL